MDIEQRTVASVGRSCPSYADDARSWRAPARQPARPGPAIRPVIPAGLLPPTSTPTPDVGVGHRGSWRCRSSCRADAWLYGLLPPWSAVQEAASPPAVF